MTTTQVSKQDYLKKYLSGDQDKKKKKKKVAQNSKIKSKIIDDDIDFKDMKPDSDELEVFDVAEEAPQIVGIIDERPQEVRVMTDYKNTKKWRVVSDEFGGEDIKITPVINTDEPKEMEENKNGNGNQSVDSNSTNKTKKESEPKLKGKKSDSDTRSKQENSDYSPSRKIKKEKSDSDSSPPRKRSKQYDSDSSPPRKRSRRYDSSPRKSKRDYSDSDTSPSRRRRRDSPAYRRTKREKSDSDYTPERKCNRRYDSPRRSRRDYYSRRSSPRRNRKSPDKRRYKPRSPIFQMRDSKKKKSKSPECELVTEERWSTDKSQNGSVAREIPPAESSPVDDSKPENTIVMKKLVLPNAEELRKEIEEMKEKEKEMKLNASENNESAVIRGTGKKMDPEEEDKRKKERKAKYAAKLAQYAIWGKGVKQVQDIQDKAKDDLYEMSKPLARYADDKDLDEMLKNKEWDGDPMLDYMRKKKKKKEDGKGLQKREYEGTPFPNRYGIKPGFRWDGVDRSNGFEKRWFEEQNAKKAREEEAFKWSTADM